MNLSYFYIFPKLAPPSGFFGNGPFPSPDDRSSGSPGDASGAGPPVSPGDRRNHNYEGLEVRPPTDLGVLAVFEL